jgi:uncharacterized protein
MVSAPRRLEMTLLPERFCVTRLPGNSRLPEWALMGSFFSVTRTGDELSVVCELSLVPPEVQSQPGWRILKVHGPFVLSEIGVLSSLASPLAEAKVSLFAISTFDTDYVLVAAATLSAALKALEQAGHKIHRSKTE